MSELYTQIITIFLGCLAIMNPIANTATFAGLTTHKTPDEKLKIATKSLLVTFLLFVHLPF